VLADTRTFAGQLCLCIVVLSDSSAARALCEGFSGSTRVPSQAGKRTAFLRPCSALDRDLEFVLALFAAHNQRAVEALSRDSARAA
jgi:hypothetical protein